MKINILFPICTLMENFKEEVDQVASYTGTEIKTKIDQNTLTMQKLFNPNTFTLNEEMLNLIEENAKLQAQCPHEFENGICKFCNITEEDYNDLIHRRNLS